MNYSDTGQWIFACRIAAPNRVRSTWTLVYCCYNLVATNYNKLLNLSHHWIIFCVFLISWCCWTALFFLVNCQHNNRKSRWVAAPSRETLRKWMDSTCWFGVGALCPPSHPPSNPPVYNTSHKNRISFDVYPIMVRYKPWMISFMATYFTACGLYSCRHLQNRINRKSDFIRGEFKIQHHVPLAVSDPPTPVNQQRKKVLNGETT